MRARFAFRLSLTLAGIPAIAVVVATPLIAAPGDLDPTFDGDGRVTTSIILSDAARALAIQPDGKIVAAGVGSCPPCPGPVTPHDFALARYNPDGSLDPTFDGDGKVTTDFAEAADEAFALAIQGDGKIVAGGRAAVSGVDFALTRYNPDGSLDPTFDGDGKVTTDYGFGSSEIHGLAIQADGKIVAAGLGRAAATDFFLARYNPNGSPDVTFDGDGKVTFLGFGSNDNRANAVVIQPDGKIVAMGCTSCESAAGNFALARINPTGSVDMLRITDFSGSEDSARAVALQTDGKIVAAGSTTHSSGGRLFALARYATDGSLDTAFDGDGKVTTVVTSDDEARGVATQKDGKIVAAGLACNLCIAGPDFGLARYNTNGSLDTIFGGGDGIVTTEFGDFDQANAVAVQADGKIVAAGSTRDGFALARYKVCRVSSRRMSIPCR